MTGDEIRSLRQAVNFTAHEFATLFGVSLSTVYRWEHTATSSAPMDPLHSALVGALDESLKHCTSPTSLAKWSRSLRKAVQVGGTLEGLRVLLDAFAFTSPPADAFPS